jgi:hypothetical protein
LPFKAGTVGWNCEFNKSHTNTMLSSAPDANMPLRLGFHSMLFKLP